MTDKPKGTISKLLEEAGIKGFEDMTAEEKKTLEEYQRVFSAPDITIKDLEEIIPAQIKKLTLQLESIENTPLQEIFIKARLRNMRMLELFMLEPRRNRDRLTRELKTRFNLE